MLFDPQDGEILIALCDIVVTKPNLNVYGFKNEFFRNCGGRIITMLTNVAPGRIVDKLFSETGRPSSDNRSLTNLT
jgi:hypothetical protein